jgi:uncharacterized protein
MSSAGLRYAVYAAAVCAAATAAYAFLVEPYWVEVSEIGLASPKISSGGLRVVQFSDIHCTGSPLNEGKLPGLAAALHPDIIVFTGDLLSTNEGLGPCRKVLAALEAPLGKYAVLGNWDEWYFSGEDIFAGTGFRVLDGETVSLSKDGSPICISGLGYDKPGARMLLGGVPAGAYSIFLHHSPDLAEDLGGLNVDLYLAGHTHGGQVAVPLYGAVFTLSRFGKKYEAGRYSVGNMTLYVNRGLGVEGSLPRVRFLARPELTVFDISPGR